MSILNIFYQEPDPDRWLPFDRYPRAIIRKLIRGQKRPSGQEMVAINLLKGLDKVGIPYRFNDFAYIKKNPSELACIIGKPDLLFDRKWENPILFGASIFSHPYDYQDLLIKYPNVKKILVPGEWMKQMFDTYYPDKVLAWPVGIDTEKWAPVKKDDKKFDFLIYNKVRWEHDKMDRELVGPVKQTLDKQNFSYTEIKYGHYEPNELKEKLENSKNVIFICEHETQGIAYQQILASDTPILAWDRGGFWEDPSFYPHKVRFAPVSSVPYWDSRCGVKFDAANEFEEKLNEFTKLKAQNAFSPRAYILENLTLEKCASDYARIASSIR